MNTEGIRELLSYLECLAKVNESGYRCNKEINDVIEALHKEFGFTYHSPVNKLKLLDIRAMTDDNKLIAINSKTDRGIGKTTELIKLAKQYNIPILVGTIEHKKCLEENTHAKVFVANEDDLRGKKFPNGVLVDDSITLQQYATILDLNIRIRGGFFEVDKYFVV